MGRSTFEPETWVLNDTLSKNDAALSLLNLTSIFISNRKQVFNGLNINRTNKITRKTTTSTLPNGKEIEIYMTTNTVTAHWSFSLFSDNSLVEISTATISKSNSDLSSFPAAPTVDEVFSSGTWSSQSWTSDDYKTIIFTNESPSGDFLTWLQANATKQT